MNTQKGFTIIELLVVIAIIGILASVVLAAVSSSRSKAQDAAIVSQLNSMKSQAELYYTTTGNNTYGPGQTTPLYSPPLTTGSPQSCSTGQSLFNGTGLNNLSKLENAITTGKDCASTSTDWSIAVYDSSGSGVYCIDKNGIIRTTNLAGYTYTGIRGTDSGSSYNAHQSGGQAFCS